MCPSKADKQLVVKSYEIVHMIKHSMTVKVNSSVHQNGWISEHWL